MSYAVLLPVLLAGVALGALVSGPFRYRAGFRAGQRDQADIARILGGIDHHRPAVLHVGATERRRYKGTRRLTRRRRIQIWWEETAPRDIDAPVRAALEWQQRARAALREPTEEFNAIVAYGWTTGERQALAEPVLIGQPGMVMAR